MKTPLILGVILARGGSKGIPRKNVLPILGHPLISYSITAGLNSRMISKLVVSTDDEEIANVARQYGAETPFVRPAHLAQDHTWSRDALQHAVVECERFYQCRYDYVIELPCVAPLRDHEDIDRALTKLIETRADSVISVCQVQDKHPVRMKKIDGDLISDFCKEYPEGEGSRRQDLPPCYIRNGAIYSMRRDVIVEEFSRNGKVSRPFVMASDRSVNIDEPTDYLLAESLISQGKSKNRPKVSDSSKVTTLGTSKLAKVLITAPTHFFPELIDRLSTSFEMTLAYGASPAQLRQLLKNVDAWIVSPTPPYFIDSSFLDHAPSLKFVGSPSTGSNHLDLLAIEKRGIKSFYLLGHTEMNSIHASAEFSFALMMMVLKNAIPAAQVAKMGGWREHEAQLRGHELSGKSLGLIGLGRIGKKMATYAKAFGMKVLGFDPYQNAPPEGVTMYSDLADLLRSADIVSLHLPLNSSTSGSFTKAHFDLMKQGSYFFNTSRGEIVDEQALLSALRSGHVAAAGVDVISNEADPHKFDHPLIAYSRLNSNLVVTPHIAGLTYESEGKAFGIVADEMIRFFKDNNQ